MSLFEQTREGQTLTEAGELLLLKAEGMERHVREIEASPEAGQHLAGSIRVSVSEGFGTWFVANHLSSFAAAHPRLRSEEHTSELQSLMRISYAVFCLQKKN